jgi:hypothetical protein
VAPSLASHGVANWLALTDYSDARPVVDAARTYKIRVPRVGANGNEIAGIQMPEVAVPVATYAGWNVRQQGHAAGESCGTSGAAIPFAVSLATRAAKDSRKTLAQLYRGRADCQARFGAAAISPALIPAP